jgi:branched-chain amino acid transport system ATP-binding protein
VDCLCVGSIVLFTILWFIVDKTTLMQKPKLLLADEPSLGLSPSYVDTIFEKLVEINKAGTSSVLLVEQNARMALEIAHRGYVFKIGSIFMEDRGDNLLKSEEVKKAFLGG